MKNTYLALMEKTLSAYTDEHICDYFDRVKRKGLSEHGFPRLTVNIGVLIAHGRRTDLLPLFREMMEFCCYYIPRVKAANDFSVREVVCCILELEKAHVVDEADIARWRGYLATIEPTSCYDRFATSPTQDIRNWALFTGVSEYFRQMIGLCDSTDFIDLQLASQLQFMDENSMYMDHMGTDVHQPVMYDIVPRVLFSLLLHFGYRGVHYAAIDEHLRRAGLRTLEMQSVTGEMAFGGRSNQFLHNEAWCAATFEFEACRYARMGDLETAARFKAAVARAIDNVKVWLNKDPVYHIKNRFPTESGYGCEKYAYFDKYMITASSLLYAAYLMCDESIPTGETDVQPTVAWQTSYHFHKLFLRHGDYFAEYDTNADPHYDAGGLGRIHRRGAPSAICLSVPCPENPNYRIGGETPISMSLCAGIGLEGGFRYACEDGVSHEVVQCEQDAAGARAEIRCRFDDGKEVHAGCAIDDTGVTLTARSEANLPVCHTLTALCFDGAAVPVIRANENTLEIVYEGYVCRYVTDGVLRDTGRIAYNRNGHYRIFTAEGQGRVSVRVEIERV